jgi:hypothetical protein
MTIRLIGATVLLAATLCSPAQANDTSTTGAEVSARRVEAVPLPRVRPIAIRKPVVVRQLARRSNPSFIVPRYAEVGNGRSCHLLCPLMGVRF